MTTIDERSRKVATNPDDHSLRWKLAKSLYSEWDYRSALEHLTVLHAAQPDQLQIVRYLAATLYRLGRYDEAATVIKDILAISPDELSLLELLARIYGAAGRRTAAAEVWKTVHELSPRQDALHPIEGVKHSVETESDSRDAPIDSNEFSPDSTCPFCGAAIELREQRCFQCHCALVQRDDSESSAFRETRLAPDFTLLVFAVSTAIVFALCVVAYQQI